MPLPATNIHALATSDARVFMWTIPEDFWTQEDQEHAPSYYTWTISILGVPHRLIAVQVNNTNTRGIPNQRVVIGDQATEFEAYLRIARRLQSHATFRTVVHDRRHYAIFMRPIITGG